MSHAFAGMLPVNYYVLCAVVLGTCLKHFQFQVSSESGGW